MYVTAQDHDHTKGQTTALHFPLLPPHPAHHVRHLERWHPPQNRQHPRLLSLPRLKHIHRSLPLLHIFLWKGDVYHTCVVGFPHLVCVFLVLLGIC